MSLDDLRPLVAGNANRRHDNPVVNMSGDAQETVFVSARPEPGLAVDQFLGDVQVTGMSRGLLRSCAARPQRLAQCTPCRYRYEPTGATTASGGGGEDRPRFFLADSPEAGTTPTRLPSESLNHAALHRCARIHRGCRSGLVRVVAESGRTAGGACQRRPGTRRRTAMASAWRGRERSRSRAARAAGAGSAGRPAQAQMADDWGQLI